MPKPTTSAVSMEGAMISSSTRIEDRAKSIALAGSMVIPFLLVARPGRASRWPKLNRHVHDGLIGLHDLVAHRHHGIQSDFSGVHRLHHVHQIGLAFDLL